MGKERGEEGEMRGDRKHRTGERERGRGEVCSRNFNLLYDQEGRMGRRGREWGIKGRDFVPVVNYPLKYALYCQFAIIYENENTKYVPSKTDKKSV